MDKSLLRRALTTSMSGREPSMFMYANSSQIQNTLVNELLSPKAKANQLCFVEFLFHTGHIAVAVDFTRQKKFFLNRFCTPQDHFVEKLWIDSASPASLHRQDVPPRVAPKTAQTPSCPRRTLIPPEDRNIAPVTVELRLFLVATTARRQNQPL